MAGSARDDGPAGETVLRGALERIQIEAMFPGLFEAAQDAILAVDERGLIHLANRRAAALLGYDRDELVGLPLQSLMPERDRAAHAGHQVRYFADPSSRPMAPGLNPCIVRKDGTELEVDISLSSFETERGRLVTATIRDVTDRKRIEGEQALHDANLVEAGWEVEREMFEAQLQQAQRLESIGQLAGGVAHDFNNLLGGIMIYAELVSTTLDQEIAARGLEGEPAFQTLVQDVGQISAVARRASELTRQLLAFSRRSVVQPEVLDLSTVAAEMEDLIRRTIGENVDRVTSVLPAGLPPVKIDRGQLEQVILNLAVNARDAMPGGGELSLETSVRPSADPGDPGHHTVVRLAVTDTGIGMSQAVADRAFEPFFTTKAEGDGSGLGLATVYGIVAQAGGRASIRSEPGVGTTVLVDLPATTEPVAASRPVRANVLRPAQGETILLVEDEAVVREPTRRILERHGYTVLVADSGDDALRIAKEHPGPIDLLFTDVVMPGHSGRELADLIAGVRPSMKILFTSGYSRDVVAHQGLVDAGLNLLPKPATGQAMLRKVCDVLDSNDT